MFDFKMDAHMHFDLYDDRQTVVDYIKAQKSYTIAVTNLPNVYKRYIGKYDDNPYLKIALGLHPELAVQYKDQLPAFKTVCDTTRFIGEIGLDYTEASEHEKEIQKSIFGSILDWSSGKKKVLSIHSRKAAVDVINLLEGFEGRVILHWYTGTLSNLERAIDKGYYFSINQQMINSNAGKKIISKIPANRILLESDAPFTRGMEEKYSTRFMEDINSYISSIYNQDVDTVKKRLKANFKDILN